VADTITPETEAEAVATPAKVKEPINPQVPAEFKNAESGRYLPGKDAAHKSQVAKAIVAGGNRDKLLAELGSDKLREGALKQVENFYQKIGSKGTAGFVKVKTDEFEARKLRGDGGVWFDGDKGWEHVASDSKIAKTFESLADRDKAVEAEAAASEADAS